MLSRTFPDGDQVSGFTYDTAGRLKSVTGVLTSQTYDAAGRTKVATYANGVTYSPARGWLTNVVHAGPGGTLMNLTYERAPRAASPRSRQRAGWMRAGRTRMTPSTG